MASATLTQLSDQIIIDANIQGNPLFPTTRLTRIINLAQRYVQTQLNGLGFKKWESSQAVTAGLGAGAFSSASNNVKKVQVGGTYFASILESPKSIMFIEVNDGTTYGVAYEVDVNKFQEQLLNTYLAPTVAKPVFMRLSGYAWLSPTTITAATAYYYKAITDLSSGSDTTEIPLEFEEYIIKKAVIDIQSDLGLIKDKENQISQMNSQMKNDFERFFGKMSSLNINQNLNKSKLQ